jgi:hypothetical protein
MILAADALSGASPATGLFRGESLPAGLDLSVPSSTELPCEVLPPAGAATTARSAVPPS